MTLFDRIFPRSRGKSLAFLGKIGRRRRLAQTAGLEGITS